MNLFERKDPLWENSILIDAECSIENGKLTFYPPCYTQRYLAVTKIIEEEIKSGFELKKVVDFGCAEMNLFLYLKSIEQIEEVICIDVDEFTLERCEVKVKPLSWDCLNREKPFIVSVMKGSVDEYDKCLKETDVFIAVELIEHLYNDTLMRLPENVFGRVQPKLAIFTTPNVEFNILFGKKNEFRHDDHKFEWTRNEFSIWASDIVKRFPQYKVKLYGIGPPPKNIEQDVGFCSQMAVFRRTDQNFSNLLQEEVQNYQMIAQYDYPYHIDNRSKPQRVVDELNYRLSIVKSNTNYLDSESENRVIPLSVFYPYVEKITKSPTEIRHIMEESGWIIEDSPNQFPIAIFPPTPPYSSEDEDEIDFYELEKTFGDKQQDCDDSSARKRRFNGLGDDGDSDGVSQRKRRSREITRYDDLLNGRKKHLLKSYSLDSCLENINKQGCFGLLQSPSSFDKLDSGYPVSFDADLTPEQVDDLTSSDSSISGNEDPLVPEPEPFARVLAPLRIEVLVEQPPVENGDLANNNRDDEGNNVVGVRPLLEPVVDPNDNFPHWLLELAPQNDEGLGDESDSASD